MFDMEQAQSAEDGADESSGDGKNKRFEYKGNVSSSLFKGDVKILVDKDGLKLTAPLDALEIPYADITAFEIKDYVIRLSAWDEKITITNLGKFCEGFYGELYDAYNKKVRKALFTGSGALSVFKGEYSYTEEGVTTKGTAKIEVYWNCVLILPPNDGGRRISLCFLTAMEKKDFAVTLKVSTGDSYTFSKMGYDLDPFVSTLENLLRSMRERALQSVKDTDNRLNPMQQQKIAKLMPEGAAVPLGRLKEIAPSFVTALEGKIAENGFEKEYNAFKKLCDPMYICVGIKRGFGDKDKPEPAGGWTANDYRKNDFVWMIALGKRPGTAAVEFAEEASATFLYSSFKDWDMFWGRLNLAMESMVFQREIIRMTDDELADPKNADKAMAVKRNVSLRFIRSHFAGRAIHSSQESWEKKILEHMG